MDRVFGTTELVEMILLEKSISFYQLFVLQRVSKKLLGVIEGSSKLQVKMFLAHGPDEANSNLKEDMRGLASLTYGIEDQYARLPRLEKEFHRLADDTGAPLFNPLIGMSPMRKEAPAVHVLPIFSPFTIAVPVEKQDPCIRFYSSSWPSVSSFLLWKNQQRPRLRGSWKKMKISGVPLVLKFYHGFGKAPAFSLPKEAVMEDFAERLVTWWLGKRDHLYEVHVDLSFD